MKTILILASLAFLNSHSAFAHGEDKAGPHGGFVRMPGAFHTEIVLIGKNKLKVYLLDIQWKNPSVVKSSVEVILKNPEEEKADCLPKKNYFLCHFSKSVDFTKKGELIVLAVREEQKGKVAAYPVPLKFESSGTDKPAMEPHGQSHH